MKTVFLFLFLIFVKYSFENIIKRAVEDNIYSGYLLRKFTEKIPDIVERWKNYKKENNIELSKYEDVKRFFVFGKNIIFIEEHNKINSDYQLAVNSLIDKDREKYFKLLGVISENTEISSYGNKISQNTKRNLEERQLFNENKDWRQYNVLGPVKYQGDCGSCYTFSTVTSVEAMKAIKMGQRVDLSEQSLVDCSTSFSNYGCSGGIISRTFDFLKKLGIPTESEYPYRAKQGVCTAKLNTTIPTILDYVSIPSFDEISLSRVISEVGPVSTAIDARAKSFMFYSKGIYTESQCSSVTLTHAITAVGTIGTQNDPLRYYIIQNSWGTGWGENGFIRLAKYNNNQCGIATQAYFPIV